MYKLIAVDMDGTLLNPEGKISENNKTAIKKAMEKGVKVVITSGRTVGGVHRFLEEINLIGKNEYLIANNGGTIYNTNDFQCLNYIGLMGKDLQDAYSLGLDLGITVMAYDSEGCIAFKEDEFTKFEREFIGTPTRIVTSINEIDENHKIFKILFFSKADNPIEEKIPQEFYDKYNIVKTLPTTLEILHKDCNKGFGVKALAEILDIKREEIICIGDQANDMEMITYAGLGIAMGNAIDEVKNIADYVTEDNSNDGVAGAIERFILE